MPVGTGYVPLRDRYCSLLLALNIKSEEYWKGGGDVLHEICETDFNQWSIDEQHQTSSYWILGFFFAKTKKSYRSNCAGQNLKILLGTIMLSVGSKKKNSQRWWWYYVVCVSCKILTNIWSDTTLQKKEVCAQRNVPAKRSKICNILCIRKPT